MSVACLPIWRTTVLSWTAVYCCTRHYTMPPTVLTLHNERNRTSFLSGICLPSHYFSSVVYHEASSNNVFPLVKGIFFFYFLETESHPFRLSPNRFFPSSMDKFANIWTFCLAHNIRKFSAHNILFEITKCVLFSDTLNFSRHWNFPPISFSICQSLSMRFTVRSLLSTAFALFRNFSLHSNTKPFHSSSLQCRTEGRYNLLAPFRWVSTMQTSLMDIFHTSEICNYFLYEVVQSWEGHWSHH